MKIMLDPFNSAATARWVEDKNRIKQSEYNGNKVKKRV